MLLACSCINEECEEREEKAKGSAHVFRLARECSADVELEDHTTPDSIANLREFDCQGMKCRIGFGSGLHAHCTGCYGNTLSSELRREVEKTRHATVDRSIRLYQLLLNHTPLYLPELAALIVQLSM